MVHPLQPTVFELPQAGMLRVADMSGVQLRCLSGSLWLTLDKDPKDIVLEAGDCFVTDMHRPAIVYALAPASARLVARSAGVPRRVPAWWQRLRQGIAAWTRTGVPAAG